MLSMTGTSVNLRPFEFEGRTVRVVTDDHGEPWFVAADVCAVLDISDVKQAVERLDDDERGGCNVPTPGGVQTVRAVNEPGLYSLILTSRKPEAKRFKRWVTHEVLPAIRKTGRYEHAPQFAIPQTLPEALRLAADLAEQKQALEAELAVAQPKALALERISAADGSVCITNAAKDLGIQPKRLFAWLSENLWIYRRAGGSGWVAYQHRIQSGLLEHKVTTVEKSDGTAKMVEQVLVTPKGLARLAQVFSSAKEDA
ncbi:BRO family protein [Tepidimonas ignava]|uniref:BRO family protein n=2 Tax=Tepidimonas ignava TaxID=114249 RepID=A0A4R3L480_9BURK|nr:BRO family protein [Tepidimonas ignava]TSE18918.1 Phage antirepressor protein KilAC domain protein [Tepidimonas ignava]